jgi:hypothetical protein
VETLSRKLHNQEDHCVTGESLDQILRPDSLTTAYCSTVERNGRFCTPATSKLLYLKKSSGLKTYCWNLKVKQEDRDICIRFLSRQMKESQRNVSLKDFSVLNVSLTLHFCLMKYPMEYFHFCMVQKHYLMTTQLPSLGFMFNYMIKP